MSEYQERNEVKMPGHSKNEQNLSSIIRCQQPIRAVRSGGIQNFSRNPEGFFRVCVKERETETERQMLALANQDANLQEPAHLDQWEPCLRERYLFWTTPAVLPARIKWAWFRALCCIHQQLRRGNTCDFTYRLAWDSPAQVGAGKSVLRKRDYLFEIWITFSVLPLPFCHNSLIFNLLIGCRIFRMKCCLHLIVN